MSADDLIRAVRTWAGFDLDQLCATCQQPFYNANALPVCYGCRRSGMRALLLELLRQRAEELERAERLRNYL